MREILFRAKRKYNGEWVEGNIVLSNDSDEEFKAIIIPKNDSNMFTTTNENDLGFENWYLVDPETVCQCTGLNGQEGRKIFEGDIVKNEYGYIGIVKWECCSFVLDWISWIASRDLYVWSNSVEVIGNIFDNPELLKGDE